MIEFRQKEFSEYDAMRYLYKELMKDNSWRNRVTVIEKDSLVPVLRGNNVVIERFVISSMFGRADRYRIYLKIGAKAKLPDEVKLPTKTVDRKLLDIRFKLKGGEFAKPKTFSDVRTKMFSKKKGKGGGGDGNNDGGKDISTEITPYINLNYEVNQILGEAVKYDKKSRTLVLEFKDFGDVFWALDILPFGINYKLYLLDA